jgi:hypothetical protein
VNQLEKLAMKQALDSLNKAYGLLQSVTEGMHDIELYLNENNDVLPNSSEVKAPELRLIFDKALNGVSQIDESLRAVNEWQHAMLHSN